MIHFNEASVDHVLSLLNKVRISSWPKEIPGSWFSEFKRGKLVCHFHVLLNNPYLLYVSGLFNTAFNYNSVVFF